MYLELALGFIAITSATSSPLSSPLLFEALTVIPVLIILSYFDFILIFPPHMQYPILCSAFTSDVMCSNLL